MMGILRLALPTLLAIPQAACSLYYGDSATAAPDASVEPRTQITVELCDYVTFFAYRDGSGAWQALAANPASPKQYSLQVTSTYEWLTVVAELGSFVAELHGATVADGTVQHAHCAMPRALNQNVAITGQMAQAGTVRYGQVGARSESEGWNIDLQAPGGQHDLLVYDATSMYVQRGLEIWQATSLGAIDLSLTGSPMVSETLEVSGAGSDAVSSYVVWQLDDRDPMLYVADGTSTAVAIPPPARVMADDTENITAVATGPGDATVQPVLMRSAIQPFNGTPSALDFALPAPMSASFTVGTNVAAQWQSLPASATVELRLDDENDPKVALPSTQLVSVSTSWLAATGATSLDFDSSAPGYDSTWSLDATRPYEADLRVHAGDPWHVLDTVQQFNATTAPVPATVVRGPGSPWTTSARAARTFSMPIQR